jgi:hypothetical protein
MTFITKNGERVPDIITRRKEILAQYAGEFERLFHRRLAGSYTPTRGFNTMGFRADLLAGTAPLQESVTAIAGPEGLALVEFLQTDGHTNSLGRGTNTAGHKPPAKVVAVTAPSAPSKFANLFGDGPSEPPSEPEKPESKFANLFD